VKNEFPGFFPPSEAALKTMWKEGVFAFDANFLLNFYRYSKETRIEIFRMVAGIRDRIWVGHQAALEFLRSRLGVIAEQEKTYDDAKKDLKRIEDEFKAPRRHPFVSDGLLKQMSALFAKLDKELEERKSEFTKLGESDAIQEEPPHKAPVGLALRQADDASKTSSSSPVPADSKQEERTDKPKE
jgi:hypothetical protein